MQERKREREKERERERERERGDGPGRERREERERHVMTHVQVLRGESHPVLYSVVWAVKTCIYLDLVLRQYVG